MKMKLKLMKLSSPQAQLQVQVQVHWLLFLLLLLVQQTTPFETDCGCRTGRRSGRIISGAATNEGQFPWQASLELLHPSLGFLGHWCGAVLIHQYWILSAAHCVHNDLFNLPIPPLWTVVLGEHDRNFESGNEQRIPVEKIVLHHHYHNFRHDVVLMKLSKPADLSRSSHIRRICLPFMLREPQETPAPPQDDVLNQQLELDDVPEKIDNFLRSVQSRRRYRNVTAPSSIDMSMRELMNMKILNRLRQALRQSERSPRSTKRTRRRNDKLMKLKLESEDSDLGERDDTRNMPFFDCVATGWGKANISGDLSNELLKTQVPLHQNRRCKDAYGSFVNIHGGHLCAGQLNGQGGTCVGDSGGPLQCRLSRDGPWILAGVTSFGSGCALENFPDVYLRISYYLNWIEDTIASH
ncbi:transmembrane protease serine 11C [Drosophila sulfurigaster albostrigata]|uniref:transmembrane protease serine 11C n=1 Tax=Drosophila sulfurigaster albostrigata TaxID=89887 RepID=UPI002D21BB2E|nr:transmembrane protease serine 11C [Drosophila sulfurigaster albostrigata]